MQFTIEIDGREVNFLDVKITNNDNVFEFDLYKNPIFFRRLLNFLSNHHCSQKRGVIISMIDRAFLLSHLKFHQKNFKFIIDTFLSNGYPLQFIVDTITRKFVLKNEWKKQNFDNLNNKEMKGSWCFSFLKWQKNSKTLQHNKN